MFVYKYKLCIFEYQLKQTDMTTTTNPIGLLKTKITKHCTICGCSTRRILTANVYSKENEEIERAKKEIKLKSSKEYTCNICKSILKSFN